MHVPVQSFTAAALGYLFVIHIQVYMQLEQSVTWRELSQTPRRICSTRFVTLHHRIAFVVWKRQRQFAVAWCNLGLIKPLTRSKMSTTTTQIYVAICGAQAYRYGRSTVRARKGYTAIIWPTSTVRAHAQNPRRTMLYHGLRYIIWNTMIQWCMAAAAAAGGRCWCCSAHYTHTALAYTHTGRGGQRQHFVT